MRSPLRPLPAACWGLAAVLLLGEGCSRLEQGFEPSLAPSTPSASRRVIAFGQPIPKGGGIYKVGEPYQVDGQWHSPREEPGYDRVGIASYYAADFHGRRTANGEIFDMWALSAAHPTLPLPSLVYVTNIENGRTLLLRVNDRGPYVNDRVIDVSRASARYLGFDPSMVGHQVRSRDYRVRPLAKSTVSLTGPHTAARATAPRGTRAGLPESAAPGGRRP